MPRNAAPALAIALLSLHREPRRFSVSVRPLEPAAEPRKPPLKCLSLILVLVIGIGLLVVSLLADVIGVGDNPGFGPQQTTGTIVAVIITAFDAPVMMKSSAYLTTCTFWSRGGAAAGSHWCMNSDRNYR
jgi:hypothetical protein